MTNSTWQATIQNATGDIVAGAEVTVTNEGTGLSATIFSTRAGAALTNPFFSDSNGFAQFYAGPGEYRIDALDGGTGLTQTLRYVRLGDGGAADAGTATGEIPTADDLDMVGAANNWSRNNLEFNVFGGVVSANAFEGVYRSSTEIIAMLNVISPLTPTGATLSVGATFGVFNFSGGGFIRSINASDITVAGTSRNKVKLLINGFTGLTQGDQYEIKVDSITPSTITIDY